MNSTLASSLNPSMGTRPCNRLPGFQSVFPTDIMVWSACRPLRSTCSGAWHEHAHAPSVPYVVAPTPGDSYSYQPFQHAGTATDLRSGSIRAVSRTQCPSHTPGRIATSICIFAKFGEAVNDMDGMEFHPPRSIYSMDIHRVIRFG
jgi:hypothetical protein